MSYKHIDEAWVEATGVLGDWLREHEEVDKAVLAGDIFGRIRVLLWVADQSLELLHKDLGQKLTAAAMGWWSEEILIADADSGNPVFSLAWEEGVPSIELPKRMRLLERRRNRGAWFTDLKEPVWQARGSENPEGPPVVVFYSFKGGLGRSTALAAFAIQRARRGERVAVLDFDLDAPGVGLVLGADSKGRTANWGVLDFLLEQKASCPLSDYYHPCRRPEVIGDTSGEILVFPASRLNEAYPGKLARVDLEPSGTNLEFDPVVALLQSIREELKPDWLLLDARTGLSEPAGALLSGIAHLHVLFGTPSEQSWQGLRVIVGRLGARRVSRGLPQGDVILVHAMVPADTETAKTARDIFQTRAEDEFSNTDYGYYADEADEFWDLRDLETEDAPHVPIPLSYDLKLAHFRDVADVADLLADSLEYRSFGERIAARFEETFEETEDE